MTKVPRKIYTRSKFDSFGGNFVIRIVTQTPTSAAAAAACRVLFSINVEISPAERLYAITPSVHGVLKSVFGIC